MLKHKLILSIIIIMGTVGFFILGAKPLKRNIGYVRNARQLHASESAIEDLSLDDYQNVFGFLMKSHIMAAQGDYQAAAGYCEQAFQRTGSDSQLSHFIDNVCKARGAAAIGDWKSAVNRLATAQNSHPYLREMIHTEFSTLLGIRELAEWSSTGSIESYCLAKHLLVKENINKSIANRLQNEEIDCEKSMELLGGNLSMEESTGCMKLAPSYLNYASHISVFLTENECGAADSQIFQEIHLQNLVGNSGMSLPGDGLPAANVSAYYSDSGEYHRQSVIDSDSDTGRRFLSLAVRRQQRPDILSLGKIQTDPEKKYLAAIVGKGDLSVGCIWIDGPDHGKVETVHVTTSEWSVIGTIVEPPPSSRHCEFILYNHSQNSNASVDGLLFADLGAKDSQLAGNQP